MKNWRFRPLSRFISKTEQESAVVTMEDSHAIYRMAPFPMTFNDP